MGLNPRFIHPHMSAEFPPLEQICPVCHGAKGRRYSEIEEDDGWADCYKCQGSGFVPTELGVQILTLMRHNSKVTVKAQLCVAGE